MDLRALGETLIAVAITPVVSIGMALIVIAAIIFLAVWVGREEAREQPDGGEAKSDAGRAVTEPNLRPQ